MRNGYRLDTARVVVEADDTDALRWLAEFVAPWFEPCPSLAGDRLIRYDTAPAAFDACTRDLARMPPQRLPIFALDGNVVMLAGGIDAGVTLVDDPELGARYRIARERIDVVARPAHPRARIALMRVVREALVTTAQARASRLDLHAAALAVPEGAVLLAGPKRTGKTTLLARLLASEGAALIANDRVLVDVAHGLPVAAGVPTLVAIRPGTLALHPHLRRSPNERPVILHSGETAAVDRDCGGGAAAPRDFSLTPAQFAQRSAARVVAAAPVAAIVFPEFDPGAAGRALVALAPDAGCARLLAARYGAGAGTRPRTMFDDAAGADDVAPERSAHQARRLAAAVPMYRCVQGIDAGGGADASLLHELFVASASAESQR